MKIQFRSLFSLTLILLLAGCNSDSSLTGTVTYSDDGTPVKSGQVRCIGDGVNYSGTIKEDGTYEITNAANKNKAGIPAGDYKITVSSSVQVGTSADGSPVYDSLIDTKYQDPNGSGFVVTIPHEGPFDMKVDRFKK